MQMQEDKKEPAVIPAGAGAEPVPAGADKAREPAAPAGDKPPGFYDKLQRAFHERPAFQQLRRLTDRHQDRGAAKPADGAAPADPARKHGDPPVPVPAAPRARRPPLVRLPAVTTATGNVDRKAARSGLPTGPPVPVPPPDVVMGGVTAGDGRAGDGKAQQVEGKSRNRVGCSVRNALSSK